jgi:hypothetical protein
MIITSNLDSGNYSYNSHIQCVGDEVLARVELDSPYKSGRTVTTVVMVDVSSFVCECDNTPDTDGFYALDANWERLDYQDNWTGLEECVRCGKIYTFINVGQGAQHYLYLLKDGALDHYAHLGPNGH